MMSTRNANRNNRQEGVSVSIRSLALFARMGLIAATAGASASSFALINYWQSNLNGYWDSSFNWSLGLPQSDHDVVIDKPSLTTTFRTGTVSINSLTNSAAFKVTGGSLTIGSLNSTGEIAVSGGGLVLNDLSASVAKFTLSGGELTANSQLSLSGLTSFTGGTLRGSGLLNAVNGFSLSGNGLALADSITLQSSGISTLSATLTMGTSASFINQAAASATISANIAGGTILNKGSLSSNGNSSKTWSSVMQNKGTISASGGALNFTGTSFDNSLGTINAIGTTVSIAANLDTANLGNMIADTYGLFLFSGQLTNSNLDLARFGSGSNATFTGSIHGGTIANSDRGSYNGVSLYGVEMDKGATISGNYIYFYDGFKSGGVLDSSGGRLCFMNDQTFDGDILGTYNTTVGISGGKTLTLAPGSSISGYASITTYGSTGTGRLINNGEILANRANLDLPITLGQLINNGSISATAGRLIIDVPNAVNNGIIGATGTGTTLHIKNQYTLPFAKSLKVENGAKLMLSGSLSNAILDMNDLYNPAATTIGGVLTKVNILNADKAFFNGCVLDASTIDSKVNLDQGNTLSIRNSFGFIDSINVSNNSTFKSLDARTMNWKVALSSGTMYVADNSTFGSGNTIRTTGTSKLWAGTPYPTNWLTNYGSIHADGGSLYVYPTGFRNYGTFLADNGAAVRFQDTTTFVNPGSMVIDGPGTSLTFSTVSYESKFENIKTTNGGVVKFNLVHFADGFDAAQFGPAGSVIFNGGVSGYVKNSDLVTYDNAELSSISLDKGFTLDGKSTAIGSDVVSGAPIVIKNGGGAMLHWCTSFGGDIVMDKTAKLGVDSTSLGTLLQSSGSITGSGSIVNPTYSPSFEPYLTNAGLIRANNAGESLTISLKNLQNNGTLSAVNHAILVANPTNTIKNYDATSKTLTSGTFEARTGGKLQLSNVNVESNGSRIIVDGAGSSMVNELGTSILASLKKNSGTIELLNGARLSLTEDFTQTGAGSLVLGGDASILSTPILSISGVSSLSGAITVQISGNQTTAGMKYDLISFGNGYTGAFENVYLTGSSGWKTYYTDHSFGIESVPEPASIIALTLGMSALIARRRNRRPR